MNVSISRVKPTGMREWRCEEAGQKRATAGTVRNRTQATKPAPKGQEKPDTDAAGTGSGSCAFQVLHGGKC